MRQLQQKVKFIFLMVMLTLFISTGNANVDASTKLKVHFVDVGQGDAILIQSGKNYSLIDTGTESNYPKLKAYLKKVGVKKISSLVLTHPDADHIGGADLLMEDYRVNSVYMTSKSSKTMEYREVLAAIDDYNVGALEYVKKGDKIPFGKLRGKVLSADSSASDTNDSSIVILLKNNKNSFLFTGDASAKLENKLTDEYNVDVDVLKISHHGSSYSSAALFLKETSPALSIISVGRDNNYGHPDKYALKRINLYSNKTYRTDKNGTVVVTSDGKKIRATVRGKSKNISTSPKKASTSNGINSNSSQTSISSTTAVENPETTSSSVATSTYVYITNTGSKYHNAGCRYLGSSKISINESDAKSRGYTPCSVCH